MFNTDLQCLLSEKLFLSIIYFRHKLRDSAPSICQEESHPKVSTWKGGDNCFRGARMQCRLEAPLGWGARLALPFLTGAVPQGCNHGSTLTWKSNYCLSENTLWIETTSTNPWTYVTLTYFGEHRHYRIFLWYCLRLLDNIFVFFAANALNLAKAKLA